MLKVNNIHVSYGKVEIIKQVSFEVNQGEVVVIIGANGAGKTTIMKTVTGLLKPTQGEILFEGQNIARTPAEKIVKLGLAMCPEGRQVFPQHTVYENLVLGGYLIRKDKPMFQKNIEQMYNLFPILKERSKQVAGTLSGGEQQMLAIARAMMSNPKLLLLDEPSAGLAPIYVKNIFDMIQKLSEQGTTILLVEQMANMALKIADRAYVLETGRIALGGTAVEIMNDPKVVESYLGSKKY
ncbi:Branched-chain amino acid transport ATP-binding protein LivF [Desulfosporosinus sp. I2]|uniref:ABC transporter ATP-binding protein n=1 Tax=Desulfosporosinus sp. I2 TaxID=1617025 RepID=UPI0005EF2C7E|nr:ABC transporter ATP-binding protein [Desulfosporosinus sp. I2]KJR48485.1 Branched-chain amino acid transport ATP-binding protein LivF [Desulfosporosinus sp. I2]